VPLFSEHRVTATVTIHAAPERVWDVLCDFRNCADWVENTLEVLRGDVATGVGATYVERARLSGMWTSELEWSVTAFDPPTELHLMGEGTRAPKDLRLEYVLEPHGEDTEVSSTYSYLPRHGPFGALVQLIVKGNVVADQCRSLRTLAHVVEESPEATDR
jgi:hypothetical protein